MIRMILSIQYVVVAELRKTDSENTQERALLMDCTHRTTILVIPREIIFTHRTFYRPIAGGRFCFPPFQQVTDKISNQPPGVFVEFRVF